MDYGEVVEKFYTVYERETAQYDKAFVERYDRELNTVIVMVRPLHTLHSRDSPDSAPCQALLYSTVGAKLALSYVGPKPNPNDKPAALPALNLGETLIVPPVQEALNEIDIAVELFYASTMLCIFAALFAMLAKQCLSNYSRHKGGSLIERCRDRQRKFDALEKWRFDLFVKSPMVMLLVALPLLICGVCHRMWYLYSPIPYVLIPLAVPGVAVCLGIVFAVMSF